MSRPPPTKKKSNKLIRTGILYHRRFFCLFVHPKEGKDVPLCLTFLSFLKLLEKASLFDIS